MGCMFSYAIKCTEGLNIKFLFGLVANSALEVSMQTFVNQAVQIVLNMSSCQLCPYQSSTACCMLNDPLDWLLLTVGD